MLQKAFHSTDEFMFRTFNKHSKIFKQQNLEQYFMISSGTNQFSMPYFWKESLKMEIDSDFLYRWYTGSDGFPCVTSAIKIYEDYISSCSRGQITRTSRRVCLATGGSGAASLAFEYINKTFRKCRVILVGMNYSLYERLARKYGYTILELCGGNDPYSMPSEDDFKCIAPTENVKDVYIFSLPNNPTGNVYCFSEFSKIVEAISKANGFIVLDTVCNIIISRKKAVFWEDAITMQGMWDSCAVVSSFSKTDAVAGLRLGYIYGESRMIDVCSSLNADTIMNPPTFPIFCIVMTCLFRCLYINDTTCASLAVSSNLKKLFRKVFYITTAIVTDDMWSYTNKVFDNVDIYYMWYISEQLENESIIQRNYKSTLEVMSPLIEDASDMSGGFNFYVKFNFSFGFDELSLTEKLICETGVAILTESSFSVRDVDLERYIIRFSAACPEKPYYEALIRMLEFLKKWR